VPGLDAVVPAPDVDEPELLAGRVGAGQQLCSGSVRRRTALDADHQPGELVGDGVPVAWDDGRGGRGR
jgi:hypothetical protein